ncbi:MAG: methyltransferase domain-containing protein [Bacteroidales bacterium]|nr:methyltransferase domain-containing protein [Bacteroidales bacterium]
MGNFEHNRESWNELTSLHIKSDFYDLKSFKKGNTSLNHIELEEIGEVKGKKLLHLQCHFGMDTLSFARLGADVTGIDISDESIKVAAELSAELSLRAKFYRSNVYEIDKVLDERFDIIYTSYGAINWLNDLDKWAKIINRFLKPGGIFYMVEFHPFIYTLNEELQINENYFKTKQIETIVDRTYTENSKITKKNLKNVEWHHSLSEVLNSLIENGLEIKLFNEFPFQVYNCFKNMIEIEKGKWVFEKYKDKIPYMFSVKAIKK